MGVPLPLGDDSVSAVTRSSTSIFKEEPLIFADIAERQRE